MRYFIVKYYKQATGKHNEQAKADNKVRTSDLQTASVILDYKERKVLKCNFKDADANAKKFDTLNDFYKKHYMHLIAQMEAKYQVLEEVQAAVKEMIAEGEGTATVDHAAKDKIDQVDADVGRDTVNDDPIVTE